MRDRLRSGVEFTLPRELIRSRLREVAQNSLTRQLGPRTIEEIEQQRQTELTANRVTPLDRRLIAHLVPVSDGAEFKDLRKVANLNEGSRLRHLSQLGLARLLPGGQWQGPLRFPQSTPKHERHSGPGANAFPLRSCDQRSARAHGLFECLEKADWSGLAQQRG